MITNTTAYSRRRWLGSTLATCGGIAWGRIAAAKEGTRPVPEGYTKPAPVTDLEQAPGLRVRKIADLPNGGRTYALIFAKRDEVMSGLTAFAVRENISAGTFTAIGALHRAKFGWFDLEHQAYRDIPIDEQVELISLIGDVGLFNGKPQVHAHGSVGLRWDLLRGMPDERPQVDRNIAAVPLPETDPLYGTEGPLKKAWSGH